MSDVDLTKLREPFPPEYVGKLPRVTCRKCNQRGTPAASTRRPSARMRQLLISERHIHLDYVGHADVTIRLLDVDPEWAWAPKATDPDPELLKAAMAIAATPEIVRMVIENAPPKFETDANGNPVGLWIKLTVGGVTRLGVGSCPSNQNDAEKVLIGDALRNAAMRFGVALDLWAKGDRADPTAENATARAGQAVRGRQQNGPAAPRRPRRGGPERPGRQAPPQPEADDGRAGVRGTGAAGPRAQRPGSHPQAGAGGREAHGVHPQPRQRRTRQARPLHRLAAQAARRRGQGAEGTGRGRPGCRDRDRRPGGPRQAGDRRQP